MLETKKNAQKDSFTWLGNTVTTERGCLMSERGCPKQNVYCNNKISNYAKANVDNTLMSKQNVKMH